MTLGASAMPPPAYMAFCRRQPQDCGDDAQFVLANVARANAERTELYAQLSSPAPAAIANPGSGGLTRASWSPPAPMAVAASEPLLPVAEPLAAAPERATIATSVAFIDPTARAMTAEAEDTQLPAMTPELWAKLNSITARVNGSIVQRTDINNYGVVDYWTTPIEDGQHFGDCEDFALEKQRALIAAGVSRQAVNLALVTTPWGESHAVLLVSTRSGDYVLDSLNPWVTPWKRTGYRWRQREVNGNPFTWAMIEDPAAHAPARQMAAPLLIASAQ